MKERSSTHAWFLVGFTVVDCDAMGRNGDYLEMTQLQVAADFRGQGIGRQLFQDGAKWARSRDASRLFLSTHPAIETQRFYEAVGCVDATETLVKHGDPEPVDRPMEVSLS